MRGICLKTHLMTIAISVPLTVLAITSRSVQHKIFYAGCNLVAYHIGYESHQVQKRLEAMNHHISEYSDQQTIFAHMEKPALPAQEANLHKIEFDSLPLESYHIFANTDLIGTNILVQLRKHLSSMFNVSFSDLRNKSDLELMAEVARITTAASLIDGVHYIVTNKYLSKTIEKVHKNNLQDKIKFIVVSPSDCPIPDKILDNQNLRRYSNYSIESMAYMNQDKQQLLAINN